MKNLFLLLAALLLGALIGAIAGVGTGFAWTTIFHTTSFEGYSGMLVFFTFMPLGAILGAIGLPAYVAARLRARRADRPTEPQTHE